MVSDFIEQVKYFIEENRADLFLAVVVFLVGIIGFGLGRLSYLIPEKAPLRIVENAIEKDTATEIRQSGTCQQGTACNAPTHTLEQRIVASKNGSTYYFPWCSNSIKEENKIYFQSDDEATKAGYRLAKNCQK